MAKRSWQEAADSLSQDMASPPLTVSPPPFPPPGPPIPISDIGPSLPVPMRQQLNTTSQAMSLFWPNWQVMPYADPEATNHLEQAPRLRSAARFLGWPDPGPDRGHSC